MQNDTLIALCEKKAIAIYKQQGLDISTKDKRVALSKEQKEDVFNLLTQLYLQNRFSGFGF